MKNTFNRIIALIIAIASLITVFSVFTFAAPATVDVTDENLEKFAPDKDLLYNRTFDDGWEAGNGFGYSNEVSSIDYEVAADGNYNYFMRMQHNGSKASYALTPSSVVRAGTAVLGLSIMADDLCDVGTILTFSPYDASARKLLIIQGHNLYAFDSNTDKSQGYEGVLIGSLADGDWYDIEFVFRWHDAISNDLIQAPVQVFVNGELLGTTYVPTGNAGIQGVTLGWDSTDASKIGMGYCIDNLVFYQSVDLTDRIDVPATAGFGSLVRQELPKTVPIYKNADQPTTEKVIANALYMKLGVKSALARGVRVDAACAPAKNADGIMVPLDTVLDYLGYNKYIHPDGVSYEVIANNGTTYITVGRNNAKVAGETVALSTAPIMIDGKAAIAIADVATLFPGMEALYDDMGLIAIYENIYDEAPLSREENLDTMLDIMKQFVFDVPAGNKDANYISTGAGVVNAVENAIHPYIITNQETFDNLNAAYTGEDSTIKSYINTLLTVAKAIYKDMADETDAGVYKGILEGKTPVNVYGDGVYPADKAGAVKDSDDGYNPNTLRLDEIETASAKLVELAFAYQITREDKYAALAYDIMLALGEWGHWGPGYMVNCATAAGNYAIAFDWLYNYVKTEKGEDAIANLAFILYDKAIKHGTAASKGDFCSFPRVSGIGDKYVDRTDSYNAICSSGMIIASLAIANENISFSTDGSTQANSLAVARENMKYLIGNNLRNLADYGLDQYAPDGSYIESVTYWALGTNALMKLIMSLESATGSDYGFKDVWGLNNTFYYACYISNGAGEAWKYHEDAVGTLVTADVLTADTQMFNYAGKIFGDDKLIAIRKNQLDGGKTVSMFDVLFYPAEEVDVDTTLENDIYLGGIDAFISRSGWEKDDLFVGIMGGMNNYYNYDGQQYGQIDSGNFIYENMGIKWIVDHGSDRIYDAEYFGEYRFNYFRNSGEAHNMFLIADLPTGQNVNGGGRIYETYVDANGKGSYAIVDNGTAYGSYSTGARRGMLIDKEKQSVVIQDEVSFGQTTGNAIWVVNTYEQITIDESKQVAYLTHKNEDGTKTYLRATIVTTGSGVEFARLTSSSSNLFSATKNEYTKLPLGNVNRLYIKANALKYDVAVVFEIVDSTRSDLEVGYKWTNLDDWNNYFLEEEEGEQIEIFDSYSSSFREVISYASVLYDDYTHLTHDIDEFYKKLSHAFYILVENDVLNAKDDDNFLDEDDYIASPGGFDPMTSEPDNYEEFVKFRNEYVEYVDIVGKTVTDINLFTKILSGQT